MAQEGHQGSHKLSTDITPAIINAFAPNPTTRLSPPNLPALVTI